MSRVVALFLITFFSVNIQSQDFQSKGLPQLERELSRVDKNIENTKEQMKSMQDATFLADLYFVLAEYLTEKSRYLYQIKILENPEVPQKDLDFTLEKRPKDEAIAVYESFFDKFGNHPDRDKALFYKAHELRELGRSEEMLETYRQLTQKFPRSQFWEESRIAMGNFYLEVKKDLDTARKSFEGVVDRGLNSFSGVAYHKLGWVYINERKFLDSYLSFEKAIESTNDIVKNNQIELKIDIRENSILDMVWPYSEIDLKNISKIHDPSTSTLEHFRKLSFGYTSYLKLLRRLAKRMSIKKRYQDSRDAWVEFHQLSNNSREKIDAVENIFNISKAELKNIDIPSLPIALLEAHKFVEKSEIYEKKERAKLKKNIERIFRYYCIQLDKRHRAGKDIQSDLKNAYKLYLRLFKGQKFSLAMTRNYGAYLFRTADYLEAGLTFERLYKRTQNKRKRFSAIKASLESYIAILKNPGGTKDVEVYMARRGVRQIGRAFVSRYKKSKTVPTVQFNIAQTYYDERLFDSAIRSFKQFIVAHPKNSYVNLAVNQLLDTHNQREDYDSMIKDSIWFLKKSKVRNNDLRRTVKGILSQARVLKIKKESGDFRSGDYAKNLLKLADRYKGSKLGDKALFEAFLLYRSQRSEKMYEPGEELLKRYKKSKYVRQVASDMAQIALNTADFSRAARYLLVFSDNYPKAKESKGFRKQAARILESIGDFPKAREVFEQLNNQRKIAEIDFKSQDWKSLEKSAKVVGGSQARLWESYAYIKQKKWKAAEKSLAGLSKSLAKAGSKNETKLEADFLRSDIQVRDFKRIRFRSSKNIDKVVTKKATILKKITEDLNKIIQSGHPKWTVASLFNLAQLNDEFGSFVQKAPIPKGLTKVQSKQYRDILSQQAKPYLDSASSYYDQCFKLGKKNRIYNDYILSCQAKKRIFFKPKKLEFKENYGDGIRSIRARLFDKPRDIELYKQLVFSLLEDKRIAEAVVTAGRLLEIAPNEAEAYNLLLLADLNSNSMERALLYSEKVRSMDPRNINLINISRALDKFFKYDPTGANTSFTYYRLLPRYLK